MEKLTTRKQINRLALLLAVTYMVSYITRTNYGAVLKSMVSSTGYSKELLSMALTGSFITYGAGQIVSGFLGDRFSPKRLVSYGLIVSVVMNLLIPLCGNPYLMMAVWCINGFAQAFMWPPMVRLMTTLLTDEGYKQASVKVSWGSSVGTIVVYLASSVIVAITSWKAVFYFSAACGMIMIVVWNKLSYEIQPEMRVKSVENNTVTAPVKKASAKVIFAPVMIGAMLGIILQGMLRDGVTTWMPTYIGETYNLGDSIAILTGVVLPIFSIITFRLAGWIYKKMGNPMTCAGVIFGFGAVSALALYLLTGSNPVFSVLFSALLTGSMHGVNLILICMIPPFFNKYGNVSTVSGVLNSCTYIGSAISTYGIALLSEKAGWNFTLVIWLAIAVAGTAVCLICAHPWKKKMG